MRRCSEPGCEKLAEISNSRCIDHLDMIDTEVMALGDPPPRGHDDWGDEDDCDDEDEDDWPMDCQMHNDGQCGAAGSEWCEFECPVMREWRADPWDENGPISDDDGLPSPVAEQTETGEG